MGNQASPELLLANNDRTFNALWAPSPASAEARTAANGWTSL